MNRIWRRTWNYYKLVLDHSCYQRLLRGIQTMSESSLADFFAPPESIRGSKVLDRASFERQVELPAIKLQRANLCSLFIKRLAHAQLRFPTIKSVLNEPGEDGQEVTKVILLAPPHLMKKPLSSEDHEWIASNGGEEVTRRISLTYGDYSKRTVLQAILPDEIDEEIPTGYEKIGHIAHYNLKEEHLPYKNIIGQVTLDKQLDIRTVVNKVDQIDSTFRFFKMEVLAGEDDLIATVKESHCIFTFDFSKVYWNSRLSTEHERVVEMFHGGDVVLDMFAGVGPFAIPAAKNRHCIVHANDLNPHSYKYLQENTRKNHVSKSVLTYNLDGRDFLPSVTRKLLNEALASFSNEGSISICDHVIMNLPASAVEFLDAFKGLFSSVPEETRPFITLPTIHCYCFVKKCLHDEDDGELEMAAALVASHLGVSELSKDSYVAEIVRSVAPAKMMVRVSFTLPYEVAYSSEKEEKETEKDLGSAGEGNMMGEDEEIKPSPTGDVLKKEQVAETREEPPSKRCKLDNA